MEEGERVEPPDPSIGCPGGKTPKSSAAENHTQKETASAQRSIGCMHSCSHTHNHDLNIHHNHNARARARVMCVCVSDDFHAESEHATDNKRRTSHSSSGSCVDGKCVSGSASDSTVGISFVACLGAADAACNVCRSRGASWRAGGHGSMQQRSG